MCRGGSPAWASATAILVRLLALRTQNTTITSGPITHARVSRCRCGYACILEALTMCRIWPGRQLASHVPPQGKQHCSKLDLVNALHVPTPPWAPIPFIGRGQRITGEHLSGQAVR